MIKHYNNPSVLNILCVTYFCRQYKLAICVTYGNTVNDVSAVSGIS